MLSRIAFRASNLAKNVNFNCKKIAPISVGAVRSSASGSSDKEFTIYAESGKRFPWEGPERDVVNFPRPVQPEYPGKTRFLFVPDEWFQFFYNKTGVTGPYVLGFGIFNYVMSKELWIIDHEYYYVFAAIGVFAIANHKFADKIAASFDKEIDAEHAELKNMQDDQVKDLQESINNEKHLQWQNEGQKMLVDAKRENVAMQLEAAYRERAMHVFNEVRKRLEFHSQKQLMERRVSQKHMVQWVIDQVLKSITPQQEKDTLKKCLVDLQALSARV